MGTGGTPARAPADDQSAHLILRCRGRKCHTLRARPLKAYENAGQGRDGVKDSGVVPSPEARVDVSSPEVVA
ncbi:hypothetical protein GCM10010307_41110 [Streptomyces vastus]|uniref:Uncharacterized protein n=1 Tax=Streptomyces vastus TaxID=285451 RepID=A0ABP6DBN8_9ACTN